jgi:folate-binding protein YgfZ
MKDLDDSKTARRIARDETVLVELAHLSLISASGPDVESFLNAQLTNDLALLDTTHSQLSAWCSAKGRMLAVFRVLPYRDGCLLQLPGASRDDILKRLRLYVLRSKVVLEIADDAFVRIGIAGPDATSAVRAAAGAAPEDADACVSIAGAMVARLPGFHPRFEILAPPADAPAIWNRLKLDAIAAGADAWTWHDIMAGIATVLPETSDAFVPQMANLDLVGGISFNKGCYTGQEIVARVHYLGRVKQRMYRAHVETIDAPMPGAAIYSSGKQRQSTGTVVVACPAPSSGYDLLAVIHTESVQQGELYLGQPGGAPLAIEPLPYSL